MGKLFSFSRDEMGKGDTAVHTPTFNLLIMVGMGWQGLYGVGSDGIGWN